MKWFKFIYWIIALVIVLTSGLSGSPSAYAQHRNNLYSCIFQDGLYAGQSIFVRYEGKTDRVVLVSYQTGEAIQEVETGLDTPQFDVRGWSEDCRYLVASLGVWGNQVVVAWDIATNTRVGIIDAGGQRYTTSLKWAPANDYSLLIETLKGGYLWYLTTNVQYFLTAETDGYGRNFYGLEWDYARNELLTVNIGATSNGVNAINLSTGQVTAFFHIGDRPTPVRYQRFLNNSQILVYSDPNYGGNGHSGGVAVWNRDTLAGIQVDADIFYGRRYLEYSPDGRYLVLASRDIYVWDLQNLIGEAPYTANFRLRPGWGQYRYGSALQFNQDVLELYNYRYGGYSFTIWQWELQTGSEIYKKSYRKSVCTDSNLLGAKDNLTLIEWACQANREF